MKEFVISDLHLGHEGILKYRNQFKTIEEHDNFIIDNWNKVVTTQDKVYVLGDVCWKKKDLEKIKLLNGKKILIAGNHDILGAKNYLKVFKDIRGLWKKGDYWLSHTPIHKDSLRYCKNIHGHTHNKKVHETIIEYDYDRELDMQYEYLDNRTELDNDYINVCCECVDYTPVEIKELKNEKNN